MSIENSENNCTFGRRLKEERERVGLSQEELGQKLDTTKRTIVNWEACNSAPNVTHLILMGYQTEIDTNFIVHGVRTPPSPEPLSSSSTPAERVASSIRVMQITADDADLITALATRLSIK